MSTACPSASLPAHAGSLPDLDTRPECIGTASPVTLLVVPGGPGLGQLLWA